jgi:hypothetical protein
MMKESLNNKEDTENLLHLAKNSKLDGRDAMFLQFLKKNYLIIMKLNLLMSAEFYLKDS